MITSLNKLSHWSYFPPYIMAEQFLQFLRCSRTIHSIETLRIEHYPLFLLEGAHLGSLTRALQKLGNLKTLMLWQCNSVFFLENLQPSGVWCPSVETLVIHPLLPQDPSYSSLGLAESGALARVRNIVISRQEHGIPLKTIQLFFQDLEGISPESRGLIEELRGCVELVEVIRPQDPRAQSPGVWHAGMSGVWGS